VRAWPRVRSWAIVLVGLAACLAWALTLSVAGSAESTVASTWIFGAVVDRQGQPVRKAGVALVTRGSNEPLAQTTTQPDGHYSLAYPASFPDHLRVVISRPHFKEASVPLTPEAFQALEMGEPLVLADVILERRVTPAFWIATLIFGAVLAFIALGKLHNTLAALSGAAAILAVSYLGRPLMDDLFIFDFEGALYYVDWNVIFLIMGMMIIIAVVERTGIFQWLAFNAYRLSRGRAWLLMVILMLTTGIASAALDNVTTMLLMTPISVQIALALGINPLTLLMPEVMASNVVGISTLIGTPTNILIGSFAEISFDDFLVNLTPGVLLALLGLILYNLYVYRQELNPADGGQASQFLVEKLAGRSRIVEPEHLKKLDSCDLRFT